MLNTWLVLLPPLIVLTCALLSRKLILSLATGIIVAALIARHGNPLSAVSLIGHTILDQTCILKVIQHSGDYSQLYIFGFLIGLAIIIELMTHTGGIQASTLILRRWLSSARATQGASLVLSCFFFIDDYLNNLTVGSIMKSLTDQFRIPRAKLAFLVDSMSGPLCVLIPASSWVAFILGQMKSSAINAQPFYTYLHSFPFFLYPLCIIASAIFIVARRISFGRMKQYEKIAQDTGNVFGGKVPPLQRPLSSHATHGSLSDFFVPLNTFIVTLILTLLYRGNWSVFGGFNNLSAALQQSASNMTLPFFISSTITLILSICYFFIRKKLSARAIMYNSINGIRLMKNSLILLLLAWSLGALLTNELHTGDYLAQILLGRMHVMLFPLMFFLTSTLICASIGSSWGTIALMVPIALPLVMDAPTTAYLLIPVLGAIISGSVAGSHFSPITDTMVVVSTSTECYHMDHVQTQMAYATPALIGAALGSIISGINHSAAPLGAPLAALCCTLLILEIRNRYAQRRQ